MSCEENSSVELTDLSETLLIVLTTRNHDIVPRKPRELEAFAKSFPPERMKAIPGSPVQISRHGHADGRSADPVSH